MFSITCVGVCGLYMRAPSVVLLGWFWLRVSNVSGGVLGLVAAAAFMVWLFSWASFCMRGGWVVCRVMAVRISSLGSSASWIWRVMGSRLVSIVAWRM